MNEAQPHRRFLRGKVDAEKDEAGEGCDNEEPEGPIRTGGGVTDGVDHHQQERYRGDRPVNVAGAARGAATGQTRYEIDDPKIAATTNSTIQITISVILRSASSFITQQMRVGLCHPS